MIKNLSYVYTLISGDIPDLVKDVLAHNQAICQANGVEFRVENFDVLPGECPAGKSDWIRVKRSSEEPNIFYVDWDCKILKFPEFNPGEPLIARWDDKYPLRALFAFYNGEKLDLFKSLYKDLEGQIGKLHSNVFVINKEPYALQLKNFPFECINHLGLGSGRDFKKEINNGTAAD